MKLDMDQLFATPKKRPPINTGKRNYDIRVTLNKSGKKRTTVRFGLLNAAANEAKKYDYAEVSTDTEIMKTRLYFRFHKEKMNANVHKLSISTSENGAPGAGLYFTITPSERAEKIYRMNWIGKTYKLQYDDENELYYIENN